MLKISLFTVLTLFFFSSFAQTAVPSGKIEGKITDEQQVPVEYATVSLLKATDSTIVRGILTFKDGAFDFDKVENGNYLIAVNIIGFNSVIRGPFTISPSENISHVGNIKLSLSSTQLKNVTITGNKPLIEMQTDKTVLNIENSALAAGNSAFEILQRAPGVSVDQSGNISLKGRPGVIIMIDGKRSYLTGGQLATLLGSTQGNSIKSVELISNPSAKYDAEGSSGIINIKLKKNQGDGTNVQLRAGGGYGKYYKANGGITFNHRNKKLNFFGNYDYADNKRYQDLSVNRENVNGTDQVFLNQSNRNVSVSHNNNFKSGLDYYINDKSVLGLVVSGYVNNGSNNSTGSTSIGRQPMTTDSLIKANNSGRAKSSSLNYNLNYKLDIDTTGKELTVDFVYSRFNDRDNNIYNNTFFNADGQVIKDPTLFRSANPAIVNIYASKIDYVHPVGKTAKLEMGVKSSFVSIDTDFPFEQLINNTWQKNQTLSDNFKYDENINSAYLNLNKDFKSTTIQVGLRAEQTNSKGDSKMSQKLVNKHYLDLFPSLSVNQTLSENNVLGFVYNRRIDRPTYSSLNPFVSFVDLYTYNKGNPFLSAQYTNSFEFSYTYEKKLNMTLGYSVTDNVMSPVLLTDAVNNTLYLTTLNLDKQNFFSFTVTSPLAITKWWNTYTYLGVYYSKYNSTDLTGLPFSSKKPSFQVNTNHRFTIDSSTDIELSGDYQYTHVYGTYIIKPLYGVDLGISRSFSDKRFNVKIAANDLFNLRKAEISSAIPNQIYQLYQKAESRIFRLTLSYSLGSSMIKAARQRSRSSIEEERRTGN